MHATSAHASAIMALSYLRIEEGSLFCGVLHLQPFFLYFLT
jgi:hypothetical protein